LPIASSRTDLARNLFAGIAPEYDRMGRIMSFGQDGRWRRFLVSRISSPEGGRVLDVASGPAS
jgi:demethylmenaquinone methyltransferase/2-methoxy-6-polyprenyl-1,4-benzoquinol methylase